ncbi:hypothetical protein ASA1KI_30750 [Opitutales bacterium ASA1]|nr:hypothetical protein ASA1KI_30750 [Opitutales bacterium ASA1]
MQTTAKKTASAAMPSHDMQATQRTRSIGRKSIGRCPIQIVGITCPPQTGTNAPVMKLARSEARNATVFATS